MTPNVVITMAGHGSRFARAGYPGPKWKLELHSKTLFDWSIASLSGYLYDARVTLVGLEGQGLRPFARSHLHPAIRDADVVELTDVTRGQAATAVSALANTELDESAPLIIYNIDTHVCLPMRLAKRSLGLNWALCFEADGDHWSFFDADSSGRVRRVAEKHRICDTCSTGLYAFESTAVFAEAYRTHYGAGTHCSSEEYVAPIYDTLIKLGHAVWADRVEPLQVTAIGTPHEFEAAAQSLRGHRCTACDVFDVAGGDR